MLCAFASLVSGKARTCYASRFLSSALLAACSAAIGATLMSLAEKPVHASLPAWPACRYGRKKREPVRFYSSRASETLGELSVAEVQAVSSWFMAKTSAAGARSEPSVEKWLAGPSAVELLRPPKKATLAYLDGKGPKPARFARVTMATKTAVLEYKVGPLGPAASLDGATIEELVPAGSIPYSKRPGFEETNFVESLYNKTIEEMGKHMVGLIWISY